MERSLISKKVIPFLMMFVALIAATAILDALLHLFVLTWIGRWLGIPGTLLILLSFLYSMRKRKKIGFGKSKTLLKLHEVLTYLGALMILVHAGVHVYAILPWLALAAMMVNIISGMTGQYLLDRSRCFLAEKKEAYAQQDLSAEAIERKLFWDATTFDLMKRWRAVHLPITLAFAVLGIAHILSIFLFWEWK
ncbi:MAG: hypothetical protein KZQ66_21235 [Candidatus Thiodiazotropha sp. (ex Lucinoma aequizonata)]|nr:hypothetical protein [Candidatus Thiodiazotropha sp. (ex Lucinoma aequizonata)]MCU7887907.1 hypothetical protein [Candidatus Thiodiazotropha sp. (ex Lucinoma aequizonata)]MCU7895559.1 hypothetical protein [Candidatus Thiodiazotropha sp. (ex Lucinoma aequizonata)]MCU7898094.1 hypothetical protein [Candidatus Thiodiazotropha sp. (ex Lucinoma aequizonata)]MCU7904187.1 hypothetical protein [Candidatus Thiodiazotropha sp. (ex Lucinoma aequizonata)]